MKHYHGDDDDLHLLMAAVETAFGGMTVDAFSQEVTGWLQSASHPQLHRPYLSCAFRAHDRAAALPGGKRVHYLHRVGRGP